MKRIKRNKKHRFYGEGKEAIRGATRSQGTLAPKDTSAQAEQMVEKAAALSGEK